MEAIGRYPLLYWGGGHMVEEQDYRSKRVHGAGLK
jgi:hypothetical protein